jgi:uncharacterized iron-regulated membrane protein
MNRIVLALLSVLIILVAGHGLLVWWTAERAHDDAARQNCMQQAEATAVIALLAPASEIDAEGRRRAISALAAQVDEC